MKIGFLHFSMNVILQCLFLFSTNSAMLSSSNKNAPDKFFIQDSVITDSINYNFDELGKDVLIVDNTQTKVGADFFGLFYSIWENLPVREAPFTVTIEERPFRGINTQVIITINDTEIFQQFLQPRFEYLQDLAEYAVQHTINYIENYEMIQEELQGEDLSGSGIY